MIVKTADLTGEALDWAVATCESLPIKPDPIGFGADSSAGGYWIWDETKGFSNAVYQKIGREYTPSKSWAQGGPIIDREKIGVMHLDYEQKLRPENHWSAGFDGEFLYSGATPLEAAMQCYVTSKLGCEIEVPDDLPLPKATTTKKVTP